MKTKLQYLMRLRLSDVADLHRDGRVDHLTYRAFERVHAWAAPRWGGEAARRQDEFHDRWGWKALQIKINRTRAAFGFPPMY